MGGLNGSFDGYLWLAGWMDRYMKYGFCFGIVRIYGTSVSGTTCVASDARESCGLWEVKGAENFGRKRSEGCILCDAEQTNECLALTIPRLLDCAVRSLTAPASAFFFDIVPFLLGCCPPRVNCFLACHTVCRCGFSNRRNVSCPSAVRSPESSWSYTAYLDHCSLQFHNYCM